MACHDMDRSRPTTRSFLIGACRGCSGRKFEIRLVVLVFLGSIPSLPQLLCHYRAASLPMGLVDPTGHRSHRSSNGAFFFVVALGGQTLRPGEPM